MRMTMSPFLLEQPTDAQLGFTGCHGLIEARDRNAMRQLAENLTDAEYAYAVGKLGEGAMHRLFGV